MTRSRSTRPTESERLRSFPGQSFFPAINRGMAVDELAEQFEVSRQLVQYRIKIAGAHALYRARQRAQS
jgi:hypothetical protein